MDIEITYVNGSTNTITLKGIPANKKVDERLRDAVEVAKHKRILFMTESVFN